jgi:hypothetical protein
MINLFFLFVYFSAYRNEVEREIKHLYESKPPTKYLVLPIYNTLWAKWFEQWWKWTSYLYAINLSIFVLQKLFGQG